MGVKACLGAGARARRHRRNRGCDRLRGRRRTPAAVGFAGGQALGGYLDPVARRTAGLGTAHGAPHMTHERVGLVRGRLRMSYYYNGRKVWSAPVGVGTPGTPTPAGHFWVRERFKILDPRSGYYPYAFGTSDYSTLS